MKKFLVGSATVVALGIGAVLLMTGGRPVLASPATAPQGTNLNASQCDTNSAPVVNITYKVINDPDSGIAGNTWATDNYNKKVQVWDQGNGTYCAIVKYQGQFVTNAGASPENTGTVSAGVTGTFEGGYQASFNGTFSPTMATNGHLQTVDQSGAGFDWVNTYFPGYTNFDQPYWSWTYLAGNNGTWVNASTGNSGDITCS